MKFTKKHEETTNKKYHENHSHLVDRPQMKIEWVFGFLKIESFFFRQTLCCHNQLDENQCGRFTGGFFLLFFFRDFCVCEIQ